MIIVVGGIKGGTGKTTLATNLAVIAAHMGKKILLVDADEQCSTYDWAEQRTHFWKTKLDNIDEWPGLSFPTIKLSGKFLYEQLKRFQSDYEIIVVDAGGRDTTSQRASLTIADIFLVPFKPRSFDIWTIGKVKTLIDEIHTVNSKMKVFVCINQGDPRGLDNDEVFKILKENPVFQVIPSFIGHRKAFANAAAQGLGVYELERRERDQKAIEEMEECARLVYQCDISLKST